MEKNKRHFFNLATKSINSYWHNLYSSLDKSKNKTIQTLSDYFVHISLVKLREMLVFLKNFHILKQLTSEYQFTPFVKNINLYLSEDELKGNFDK